jgi:hypothetical protein
LRLKIVFPVLCFRFPAFPLSAFRTRDPFHVSAFSPRQSTAIHGNPRQSTAIHGNPRHIFFRHASTLFTLPRFTLKRSNGLPPPCQLSVFPGGTLIPPSISKRFKAVQSKILQAIWVGRPAFLNSRFMLSGGFPLSAFSLSAFPGSDRSLTF